MKVDPMELIQKIKMGQNPQQLLLSMLEDQASENPIYANLANLARNNRGNEIEMIIRNMAKERGITNFDEEFAAFKRFIGM